MENFSARKTPSERGFSPWEIALAKRVVYHFLATRPPFRYLNAEDLAQECLAHWCSQRRQYSPSRGASMKTYTRNVLEKMLIDVERHERAAKRGGYSEEISLDQPLDPEAEDSDTIGDRLPADSPDEDPQTEAERLEMKANIDRALSMLTPQQKKLAQKLGDGWTMSAIGDSLGTPRATLYDELKTIREVFRDQGLEEFLK
ncbi:MAG: sigma-70 family RNA polymerase sigma factor [Chloroflexota bacterium]